MRRIDIYITDPQHATLASMAADSGITLSEHVRRGIDEYLAAQNRRRTAEEDRKARQLQAEFIRSLRGDCTDE